MAVSGRARSRVATDPDGTSKTSALQTGMAEFVVTAPDFEPSTVRATVVPGGEVPITVTLARPQGVARARHRRDRQGGGRHHRFSALQCRGYR